MLSAYQSVAGRLVPLLAQAPLESALWIDLIAPDAAETALVRGLGVDVPTLAEMEEIEISNRLYREDGADYMTVVLSGRSEADVQIGGPVTFVLTPKRLVTVRHHWPRPFETYPERADKAGPGCSTPDQIFLGVIQEIIGRLADHLENVGRGLDAVSRSIFGAGEAVLTSEVLQATLRRVGGESDVLGRVRLSLMTLQRAISFYGQTLPDRAATEALHLVAAGLSRDIQALEVHADFLSNRVAQASDATLGMINLAQNSTVRIVSVVAVLFLPPTLIASIYGMNFKYMPELAQSWGYGAALGMMVLSAVLTYVFFKWKQWL